MSHPFRFNIHAKQTQLAVAVIQSEKAENNMDEYRYNVPMVKSTLDIIKPAAAIVEGHRKSVDRWKDTLKGLCKGQISVESRIEEAYIQPDRAQQALRNSAKGRGGEEAEAPAKNINWMMTS
eukprot:9483499-Pyramimonas_sp.AAC.1